ncbi:hypothetical protein FBU30_005057 [Linnemannia zychae]|nr:hypothetical protein FBU30_005057 [Linnemannia zychae]
MSAENKHPTPAPPSYPSPQPAAVAAYPPPQQPVPTAAPGQQIVYDANGNAYMAMVSPGATAPGAPPTGTPYIQNGQPMMHPPPMFHQGERRNQALIQQYQQTIQDNEIGCSDIFWFICCGPFALICCLPKYNASQDAKTKLQIELAKPA